MNAVDPEVHSLTGAYVCHALDPAERTAFERHLAQCPTCAQEVAELLETTALLGSAVAVPTPPRLKAAVDARIAVTRQLPPLTTPAPVAVAEPPRRRWFTALGWGLATGLAVAVAVLAVQVGDQQHQLNQARQQNSAISSLLTAPDARGATAAVQGGGNGMVLVSRSSDEAAISVHGLTKLPPGKAYQLWMMGPSGAVSGGLLPTGSDGSSGSVIAHGLGDARTIGLTVEPATGSAQPTTTPVMLLPMPA